MQSLWLVSLVGVLALAWSARPMVDLVPFSDGHINLINSIKGNTWKAGKNFRPSQLAYVRNLLGVDMKKNAEYNRLYMKEVKAQSPPQELPESFDARTKWSGCPSITEVRDQGDCGSCWAFSSAEVMTDRICIHRQQNVHISAEDLNSCCIYCGDGCDGGFPIEAFNYWTDDGVVTGGIYGSKQGCMPYSLPPCEHHVVGPLPNCSKDISPTPECTRRCIEGYPKTYQEDKYKGASAYGVEGVKNIMNEIFTNGPVVAAFDVYEDFPLYKSGVYKHVVGKYQGGHAVKIIGWGVDNGTDYWTVANSWNTDWGDKGFFKIVKGVNECNFESAIVAGMP